MKYLRSAVAPHGANWSVRYGRVTARPLGIFSGRPGSAESNRRQERCQENGVPPDRAFFDRRCKIALVEADTLSRTEALEEKSMRDKPELTLAMTAPLHDPAPPSPRGGRLD